jgi:hypothetical protein
MGMDVPFLGCFPSAAAATGNETENCSKLLWARREISSRRARFFLKRNPAQRYY